jgi:octaprenyl-diphosphate synthase
MDVIRAKTAKLFAAASEIGAVVSERPSAEAEALQSYGMNFGIAFQLVDDVLDYSAEQTKLGKTIGDDFREGKITLPVVLAWRRGSEEERTFWRRTLEKMDQHDGDLERAIELMNKHDALSDTIERSRHFGSIARDALGLFPDTEIKGAMTDLIDFCIERAY